MQLWVRHGAHDREAGAPYPAGLAELGIDPSRMLLVRARDVQSALQAGLEGARCASLGAAIIELWGESSLYDLTASRRLALAARASGSCVLIVRSAAAPHPSAAETRWLARAAPSRRLAANAPGRPAFYLSLLRGRHGQEGLNHHLEWNRDAQRFEHRPGDAGQAFDSGQAFRDIQPAAGRPAPLPGLVVSVSFDRQNPPRDEPAPRQRAG
jgi:protein ImuA